MVLVPTNREFNEAEIISLNNQKALKSYYLISLNKLSIEQ